MSISKDKTICSSNPSDDSKEGTTIFSVIKLNQSQACGSDEINEHSPISLTSNESVVVTPIAQAETNFKTQELKNANESNINPFSKDHLQSSIPHSSCNERHTEKLEEINAHSESNITSGKRSESEIENTDNSNSVNRYKMFSNTVILEDDEDKGDACKNKNIDTALDTNDKHHQRQNSDRTSATLLNVDSDNLLQEVASPGESHSNDQFSEEETKNSDSESSVLSQEICKQFNSDFDEELKEIDTNNARVHETNKVAIAAENGLSSEHGLKSTLVNDFALKNDNEVSVDANVAPSKNDKNINNLDITFLKRFKKSIKTMTKSDLEELILQKIVESIVYRTDLSDLREVIDKQDKMISSHRIKISELTKQFRDLEMVHNRVVKDLEQKTEQFVMPVKITRAVGLQVLIPKRAESLGNATTKSLCHTENNLSSQGQSLVPFHNPSDNLKRAHDVEFFSQEPLKRMRCNQKVTPLRPGPLQKNIATKCPIKNTVPPINEHQPLQAVALQSNRQHSLLKTVRNSPLPLSQTTTACNQNQFKQQAAPIAKANNAQTKQKPLVTTFGLQQQNFGQKFTKSLDVRNVPVASKKQCRSLTYDAPQNVASSYSKANEEPHANKKSIIDLTAEDEKPAELDKKLTAIIAQPQAAKSTFLQPQNRVATYVINKANTLPQRSTISSNGRSTQKVVLGSRPSSSQAVSNPNLFAVSNNFTRQISAPAPLPAPPLMPSDPSWKAPPPRPTIRINNVDSGIVISWTMDDISEEHADITSYQIYAYQEAVGTPQIEAWRHVGDVKAMLLPMAVTLTQFQEGQRYFFAVRAIDIHSRFGSFSIPKTWS